MNLKEKVMNLPSTPGVYLYKDLQGNILYVGKAKNLKRRVGSYFQNSKSHSPKIKKLIKHLKDFEYRLTDTEFEAFMLECSLIKEYKPIYNKRMNNTQAYTYIVIQKDKTLPIIKNTQNPTCSHSDLLFGPYTSKNTVERALQAIKEHYKIVCGNPTIKNSLCLNYSLGTCFGMCLGGSAIEEYNRIINKIILLLKGSEMSILEELEQKMNVESKRYHFEAAAKYRDDINAVNSLVNKEKVLEFAEENKKLAIVEYLSQSMFKLFLIQGNMVIFSEIYSFKQMDEKQLSMEIKEKMVTHFKFKDLRSPFKMGKEELDGTQIIYNYVKGSNTTHICVSENSLDPFDDSKLEEAIYELLGCI